MYVIKSTAKPAFDVGAELPPQVSKILVKVEISLSSMLYGVFQKWKKLFLTLVINLVSKCCKPNTWDPEVRAKHIVSLYVRYLSESSSFLPIRI